MPYSDSPLVVKVLNVSELTNKMYAKSLPTSQQDQHLVARLPTVSTETPLHTGVDC